MISGGLLRKGRCFSVVFLSLLAACGGHGPQHPAKVRDIVQSYEGEIDTPKADHLTAGKAKVSVQDEGRPAFFSETRIEHLRQFPCRQCHQPNIQVPEKQAAHWDVVLKHGNHETMNCLTCHDADSEMMTLKTLTGAQLEFDRSFDLCGQCHFEQRADWAGGAHGKRVAAWAGPRLIRNCTGCHDPHRPELPPRWPAMAPGPVNIPNPVH